MCFTFERIDGQQEHLAKVSLQRVELRLLPICP